MKHRIEVPHAVALAMFALASGCSTSPTGGSAPAGSPPASSGATGQWVSVAKADAQEAFVDPATVAIAGNMVEVRAKQNFINPQPAAKKDRTYLSSQST